MSFPVRRIKTARTNSRGTFRPTIQDFNDQIIDDDILYIDAIGRSHSECSFFTRAQSPFKRSSSSTVRYSTDGPLGRSQLPAPFNSPRDSMANADELHRRHVVKSARLRSRLSSRKQGRRPDIKPSGLTSGWQEAHPGSFAPTSNGNGQERENPSRGTSAETKQESVGVQSFRVRPGTTGRYFDSSNGLCTTRSFVPPQRMLLRPHTASGWNGCSLKIQKMTLSQKFSE